MLPKLRGFTQSGGVYTLPNIIAISGPFEDSCCSVFLQRTERTLQASNRSDITLSKDDALSSEEYIIVVDNGGVKISAASENSVILAFATLYQMIDKDGNIPHCQINDAPRYGHRGLSFDCARHFFPADEIKRIIEQMSLVKMNVLHWHLADDQGWRIESKRYPKLHAQNEYYSQQDIADIVAFAGERGVEIIPEIDMPGHARALLAAYPEYSCSGIEVKRAEYGGIYSIVLCAGNEKTYEFVGDLLDEICPLFPSSRFHIGGDEVPKKEWKKCSHCQAKIHEMGLKDETELQAYFSNRVIEMLARHGKSAVCWNDSLEATNLNRDVLVQYWSVQYADDIPPYVNAGGKFIYSDMFRFYFDYPYFMIPLEKVYNGPMSILETGYSDSAAVVGIEACLWSERIVTADRLEEQLFPRLYAVAEVAWHDGARDYADFKSRLSVFLDSYHSLNLKPAELWDPQGETRKQELVEYMSRANAGMPEEVRRETMENYKPNKYFRDAMASFYTAEDAAIIAGLRGE